MNLLSKRSGFTLIELLVVISIIGILSAILYANFGDARSDARNKAFRVEVKETQLAIELYKAQNGRYPTAEPSCSSGCVFGTCTAATSYSSCGTTPIIGDSTTGDLFVPEFSAGLPSPADSTNPNCNLIYETDDTGSWYKLTAANCMSISDINGDGSVTAADGVQPTDDLARFASTCAGIDSTEASFYESIAVYSDGGQCK